jgi:hypothetical protein
MKRSTIHSSILALAIAAGFGAAPFAQQATPKEKVDTVVVTGCVAAGAKSGEYVLNNAEVGAVASTTPNIMHSAPAADMNKDGKSMSYPLKGGDVKGHVGHKVAVTGTLEDANPSMAAHQMPGQTAVIAAGDTSTRTLNVKAVKMVAQSCS